MSIKATILSVCIVSGVYSFAQPTQFSLATDFTVIHSFKKEQRFWTIGQTIASHFHFTQKDGIYALFTYSGKGKFSNQVDAIAKDSTTIPQQMAYTNKASMGYNHISVGWKHYLKGGFNTEYNWNLYGYAGFGLFFGRVENSHSINIDTAGYHVPVLAGKGNFKRLTLDLGLGFEVPAGGGVYFYFEGRGMLPTTDFPSNYLFVNNDAPYIGSVNMGIRILFD